MTTPPTTKEEADAWFACSRLRAQLSGRACALRWARAADQEGAPRGKVKIDGAECQGCPLGEARHRLGAHERPPQFITIEAPRTAAPEPEEAQMIPSAIDRVRTYVFEAGPCTASDVTIALELSMSTVHKHLSTLMDAGKVAREIPDDGRGKAYRYYVPGLHEASAEQAAAPAPAPPPPAPEPTMPDPRWEPGGPDAPDPLPLGPAEPDPPAELPPAAEVVELQPEVSTVPARLPSEDAADAAADAYIVARDRLSRAAELAVQLLDGEEVEVIAAAEGLQRLADALQASYRALDDARNAVAADRYDALLEQMGVAA